MNAKSDRKSAVSRPLVLMNRGGLRSLIALAVTRHNHPNATLELVFIDDGRSDAAWRWADCRAQAETFGALRTARIPLPGLCRGGSHSADAAAMPSAPEPGVAGKSGGTPALLSSQTLLASLAYAADRDARQLIWPVACDQQVEVIAQATQRVQLTQMLLDVESFGSRSDGDMNGAKSDPSPNGSSADHGAEHPPAIIAPLLDWTDRQVVELAVQIEAPIKLAGSCPHRASGMCVACPACVRRRAAFTAAGVRDPLAGPMPGLAGPAGPSAPSRAPKPSVVIQSPEHRSAVSAPSK